MRSSANAFDLVAIYTVINGRYIPYDGALKALVVGLGKLGAELDIIALTAVLHTHEVLETTLVG